MQHDLLDLFTFCLLQLRCTYDEHYKHFSFRGTTSKIHDLQIRLFTPLRVAMTLDRTPANILQAHTQVWVFELQPEKDKSQKFCIQSRKGWH